MLHAVAQRPKASQSVLVQTTGIDRTTMTDIVKRLVARGYLKRGRSRSDARAYVVDVTPDGPILADVEGSSLATLALAERRAFLLALERMTTAE